MINILSSLILALWLVLSMNRSRQIFFETSIYIIAMIGINCIMQHAWPDVNGAWLLGWIVQWFFVFIAIWLFDIVALGTISALIYSIVVGVIYYYLQLNIPALVEHWIK